MKYSILFFSFLISSNYFSQKIISYANPMTGTKNMGHTFPGATAPFGMVQLSPETDQQPYVKDGKYNPETYHYCAGYQYEDSTIFGFSHTHLSGTGHSDLGDFLIMPTVGKLNLEPGDKKIPKSGFHSQFSHSTEKAEPGFYSVMLDDYNIKAELTATERVGFHKYTFPKSTDSHIILDLMSNIYNYDGKNVWTFVRVENDSTVVGYRETTGWARTKKVFFAMKFSKPFKSYGRKRYEKVDYNGFYRKFNENENFPEIAGRQIRAYFNFDTKENESIEVKFALSNTSTDGAMKNLQAEVPNWNFDQIKKQTQDKWEKELSRIQVESLNENDKKVFYTSMYHTMMSPSIYEDVDGKYLGLDQNIHQSDGFTNYTIFSLWDTYRALHPLYNIFQPKRNNDFVHSMMAHYEQSVHHALPIWSLYANEDWCMTGYHSVSVIADAIMKGNTDININEALTAMQSSSNLKYYDGIDSYLKYGFVPEDLSNASVSKTLEYAYDDWTIAQVAKKAENTAIENEYLKRSENYKNVYDSTSGYMRPKLSDGTFKKEFDPMDSEGQGFIEGNAFNYGLYVPQNVPKMIEIMGGKDKFSKHLDSIFTTPIPDKYIERNEDITRDGIIGNYIHGNEPGHHIPYLYNWTNDPWKTQEKVRLILNKMYHDGPAGLCGNDDAGQMSAWYIFSAMGFYSVLPGSNDYALGSPLVKSAVINLENGKKFTIKTENQSAENVFVKKVTLNGKEIKDHTLHYQDIIDGGTLVFYMSKKHN
ncbi:GH92 family glycosyl hydrolase [Halpernia frigidisoli]|uniref:Alpha-1,2-mannosidase, putative n=1 Tax=Halpernia frigidisoli TaxID=1125876 RepID=A0A1I3HVG6_9FLAO|nr:GH92 family glycosyl hydrolase [Halpernia frigidisoli]SFI39613.1 alpha-1,2-mannosidase, putative [Halpernia frigidisoli]